MRYDVEKVGLLGPEWKAVPVAAWGTTAIDFVAGKPGLADLPTPVVTLDADALENNLATLAEWARAAGVDLAPHGKTTMAPSLWRAQLDAGAWGLTVATPWPGTKDHSPTTRRRRAWPGSVPTWRNWQNCTPR